MMSGRAAARARRKLVKFKAFKKAVELPKRRQGEPPAGDRLAPPPEQVPLLQIDGRLEVGEPTYTEPPEKWKPPFVSKDLWCECYHPDLPVNDREWLVIWAFFGRGRGSPTATARALIGEQDGTGEAWTAQNISSLLRRPHIYEACEYVRSILSNACLNEHDLRAWWSGVVQNERVEIAHRLNASASLAKSMGLFIEKKKVEHSLHVDLAQLSNEELARIAAGDRLGSHVVDAQLTTTATTTPESSLPAPQQAEAGAPAQSGTAETAPAQGAPVQDETARAAPAQGGPRKRGRPKGSKNKSTLLREAAQGLLLDE